MNLIVRICVLFAFFAGYGASMACGLDDCNLPARLHQVGPASMEDGDLPTDQWAWMNHELAVARMALSHGRPAFALETAHALYSSLEAQGFALATERGAESVDDFSESLQELVLQCGGSPLRKLQLALRTSR